MAAYSIHKFEVEDFASAFIRLEGGMTLLVEAGCRAAVQPLGDGEHPAVVEEFVAAIRAGESEWRRRDGSISLNRALVIDACYTSAREQREVRL